jgi:hypothetical protein
MLGIGVLIDRLESTIMRQASIAHGETPGECHSFIGLSATQYLRSEEELLHLLSAEFRVRGNHEAGEEKAESYGDRDSLQVNLK